jgi:hypothetical protein
MLITEADKLSVCIELDLALHFVLKLHARGVDLLEYFHLSSGVGDCSPVKFLKLGKCILKLAATDQNLNLLELLLDLPKSIDVLVRIICSLGGVGSCCSRYFCFKAALYSRKNIRKLAHNDGFQV